MGLPSFLKYLNNNLSFSFNLILAQVYEIDTYNNQTVNTCAGTFYDSGGQSGSYAANEVYTVTFCPGIAGMKIRVDFTTFSLAKGDFHQEFTTLTSLVGCPLNGDWILTVKDNILLNIVKIWTKR